ncbi:MAG: hypothetical protein ABWZ87_01460 [Aeromicrobium sp.]
MSRIPAPLSLLVRSISRPALVGVAAGAIAAVVSGRQPEPTPYGARGMTS